MTIKELLTRMLLIMRFLFDLLGKLKLEQDFSRYNYLGLDSAKVNGVDDAANFRTVRVRINRGWVFAWLYSGTRRIQDPVTQCLQM